MRQFTVTYSMLYNFSARLHKDIDNYGSGCLFSNL